MPDDVGFADPGPLLARKTDGDDVAGGLKGANKGVDVRR